MTNITIAAFDIGKVNFAFYVEEFDANLIKNLKIKYNNLHKKFKRRVKGPMNDFIQDIQNEMFKNGKLIGMGVFDIREDKESQKLDIKTRLNLYSLLEKYIDLWSKCDIIIIEQQYFNIARNCKKKGGGTEANVDAIKLAECCITWFLVKFAEFKQIEFFSSVYKTHSLGAPDKLTKPQRKKWSNTKGEEILKLREDYKSIEIMNTYKNCKGKKQKLDDVKDCIIMLQSYKFLKFII